MKLSYKKYILLTEFNIKLNRKMRENITFVFFHLLLSMSVSGGRKRRSRSSFVSIRYVSTDEEEEFHRQTEAENLRISLHQIKNIEPILK
jgi:hypothetical protein